jgi:tetratricopeptide (TPR) repeat protein
MDFDAHSIRIKSSILASHLLHNVFSAKRIVTTLIGMVNQAEARRSERDFHQILSSLMRYGSVSLILPEDNRLEATTTFYEGIKNLPSTKANPQFWLQYAIACLAFDKLERAERYFEDAYSLAEKMDGYDTFQIDNHYARLLLEKALTKVAMDDVVLLVDDAKKIILRQMQGEFRYYPYRVALGLFRCFERFAGKWSPAHVAYFKRIFEEIKRRCEGASPELKKNNYVIDCLKQSEVLLGRI